jgi:hypothetical protein
MPRDCGDTSGNVMPIGIGVALALRVPVSAVLPATVAAHSLDTSRHAIRLFLPGRADSDSSGSSRTSTPRVPDAAIFDRRSLVAEFAADKCLVVEV